MTYDPDAYWLERGRTYEARFRRTSAHAQQETALLEVLGRLKFDSVLEVGAGFGRIGQLIADAFPAASYVGVEPSPDLRASSSNGDRRIVASIEEAGEPVDLVIAVEVAMHQPPDRIEAFLEQLRRRSRRQVVTVDWDQPLEAAIAEHNFLHDYARLLHTDRRYPANRRQGIWVARGLAR